MRVHYAARLWPSSLSHDTFQHVIYESIIISAQFSATSQKWLQEELDSAHNVQKNPSSRQQERNVQNLVRPFAV